MRGGGASAALVWVWRARSEGCVTAALSGRCRRMCSDEVKGLGPNRAKRTVSGEAGLKEPKRGVGAGSAGGRWPNEPLHVTAARLRFLRNLDGHGGAAALERRR
jgi:hypothetical protein